MPHPRTGAGRARAGLARAIGGLRADPTPLLAAAACVAAVAYADHVSRLYHRNVVDDSLISMQYAKNVALGRGAVFNAGERVEGYTNFLWVAFLAPLYAAAGALGVDFVPAAVAASVAFAALDVGLVYLVGRQIWGASPLPALLALGLCAADGAYATWAAMALEGHLLAFWVLLVAWLGGREGLRRRWLWTGLALAAATMTRPDGALLAIAYAVSEALGALGVGAGGTADGGGARGEGDDEGRAGGERERVGGAAGRRGRAGEAVRALGAGAGVYALYFAWRYSYYGYLLPNTYYFKLGGAKLDAWQRGFRYLAGFFAERGGVPALAALGPLLAARRPAVRLLALYAGLHLAYVAYVGGDFYPGHRFLLVLVPTFGLLAGAGLDAALRYAGVGALAAGAPGGAKTRRRAGGAKARGGREGAKAWGGERARALVAGAGALAVGFALRREFVWNYRTGPVQREVKRWGAERERNRRFLLWLRDHKRPGASIATGDVGSAGFFGEFDRVVDLLGVLDPVIAHQEAAALGKGQAGHEKWATAPYVVAKRPTYIKLGYFDEDFTKSGYFLWGDMPRELGVAGLWALDELAGRGRYDAGGAFHFDLASENAPWAAEGDAFAGWPAPAGRREGQPAVVGQSGGFVNTFHPELGDRATGRLVSPPFALEADKLVLRVGGGHEPERLRVSLVVGGTRVRSETGRGDEALTRREWDVTPWRGASATIEIVDREAGAWGHLLVDEIVAWKADPR